MPAAPRADSLPLRTAAFALALVRLALAPRFDLSPDEAYYLTWVHHAHRQDHPPLIAWLAALPLRLDVRPIELAARSVSVVCALVSTLLLDALLVHLDASPRARWTLLAMTLLPLPTTGALLLTPDAPLLALGSLALLLALSPRVSPALFWALLPPAAALSALAKAQGLMVLPMVALAQRSARTERPAGAYVAALLAQVAVAPWLLPSLRFQLVHAFSPQGPTEGLAAHPAFPLAGVLVMLSGQLGLLASALPLALRAPRDSVDRALVAFMALPLAAVLVSSIVRVPEPNWTAPAWPAVLVYLCLGAPRVSTRTWRACVALTAVLAVLLHAQAITGFLPIPPEKDQSARMLRGWKNWVCHNGPLPASDLPAYAAASEREIYQNRCGER